MTTIKITKTVRDQMVAALRAVRDWDYDQYNETGMPAALLDKVENAIMEAEADPYTRAMAAADAVLPTTIPVELPQPASDTPPLLGVPFMTLSEFRASGREVNNAELEEAAGCELGHNQGGRVYGHGYLYIEHYADEWCLTIMNDSWTGPLKTLEAILYGYARVEILPHLKGEDEQQALIDEWQTFCKDEGLPHIDAEELLHMLREDAVRADADGRQLIEAQSAYTRDYISRWEHWAKQQ